MGSPEVIRIEVVAGVTDKVVDDARRLLVGAIEEPLRDDRFSARWADQIRQPDAAFGAAVASQADRPVGIITMHSFRDRVMLESLLAPHLANVSEADLLDQLLDAVFDPAIGLIHADAETASSIELWAKPADDVYDDVVPRFGFVPHRTLLQLRSSLPVEAAALPDPPILPTRALVPGQDEAALLSVNNRAFASHPDQGHLTLDELHETMTESWFDPEGVRLYERNGRLAGFCWTKVHTHPVPLGEIYVIGVDPDFHGQGLGVPMTNSGLHWLAEHGQQTGMLYVEGDNEPALATYARLGFSTVRTDRAWLATTPLEGSNRS